MNQRHFVTCNQHEYIDIKGQPPGSCNASQNDRWQAGSHRPQCKPSQGTPKVLEQWYEQTSSTDKNVWAGPFVRYLRCAAAISSNRSVKPCLVQHLDWKHQRWNQQGSHTAVHLINVRTATNAGKIDRSHKIFLEEWLKLQWNFTRISPKKITRMAHAGYVLESTLVSMQSHQVLICWRTPRDSSQILRLDFCIVESGPPPDFLYAVFSTDQWSDIIIEIDKDWKSLPWRWRQIWWAVWFTDTPDWSPESTR